MTDHADGFPAGVERIQRGVQRAKAFVEQRFNARFMADQIGQRQREADEEALAAGQRTRVARGIGLLGIDYLQLQFVADAALQ
ncbi:hypothetical protein E05_38420 [Plautia stali symbiont]|nr:hypothetical protein E05_38420 [Plautia stali symbiont]